MIIFDFDGVLINSNNLKNKIFVNLSNKYFKDFIKRNSAQTRETKIKYLCELDSTLSFSKIIDEFGINVNQNYKKCEVNFQVLNECDEWAICSAGDTQEIYNVLKYYNVNLRQNIILGGQLDKTKFLNSFSNEQNIFFGDSEEDYLAAQRAQITFVFCEYWALNEELKKMRPMKIERCCHQLEVIKRVQDYKCT
jgi:phosphoglycolate phosphatase-like HAD superfamily hydrolase